MKYLICFRYIDKANSNIFHFNFASFLFIVTGKLFYTKNLYILQLKELFLNLSLKRYHVFQLYLRPLKNTFFIFYKSNSAAFKVLYCLDRISLMTYKKHLSDKFKKMN